ncbi:signal peptidase I [Ornithinibacillus sp. BX22]|uniref:Signal peptidase I n=2 Tax=Ornithinibacillus TaxID=484508 RepID=A0A923L7J2_9BACI|nr:MULTISPECIES: signal peptidase I [Ornithinibacillus]MBC5637918.1 signal peptidase I [Ornithinibacillus hominis]MBS3681718.1 signal peptidase I [Ornithinibacillus massiliensis]
MNLKTVAKWTGNLLTYVMMAVLIFLAVTVVATKASGGEPEILGYQLKTVLSGSMEPEFNTGSIIAVEPGGDMTRFQSGDVITFVEEDGKLITHRVIEVVNSGEHVMYRTKGDNNASPDSSLVLSDNVVAQYTGFTIPYLGYVVNFAQSQNGAFLLLIPGFILIVYAGFTIWQAVRELEATNKELAKQINENSTVS